MAAIADRVVVELELRDRAYQAQVRANEAAFRRAMQNTANAAQDAERRIRASSDGIASSLRSTAAALAAGVSAGAIARMADSYTSMQNRLKVTGLETAALADQFDKLNTVADASRSPLEGIVGTYSRLRLATEGLGFTNAEVTRTTEILAKALKASGASAQETGAALLQFGQGVGSGALQGDELRSIRENAPLVAKAIADEFNVTIGGLKKLGEEGKLTSERVVKAVLASGQAIDAQWAKTDKTVGDALTNLQNRLIRYIGESDAVQGATLRFTQAIGLLADNLETIVPALATLSVVIGARMVSGLVAASVASDGFIGKQIAGFNALNLADRSRTTSAILLTDARIAALNAEIAVLARQVATGRAVNGQFISQAAASRGLTLATAQLAEAQAAQAAAARAAAIANTGLVAGAKTLGSGLLGLVGGPVGIAIIAITALAFAYMEAEQNQKEFEAATKTHRDILKDYNAYLKETSAGTKAVGDAATDSVIGLDAMCDATDRAAEAMWGLADAQKEVFRTRLLDSIAANNEQIQKLERPSLNNALQRVNQRFKPNEDGTVGYNQGPNQELIKALKEQNTQSWQNLLNMIDEVRFEPTDRSGSGGVTEPKGKGKTAEQLAKEAEARARLLVDLERTTQLEEAGLAQNVARVRELERAAEIEGRIRALKDAGFSDEKAAEVSGQVQGRLDEARLNDRLRLAEIQERGLTLTIAELNENFELARSKQRQIEYEGLLAAHKENEASDTEAVKRATEDIAALDEARLNAANRYLKAQSASHAIRIAELSGNEKLANSLRDQEAILQRTNELRAQGLLSLDAARSQATSEVTAERSATKYGEQREFFASTFSEGIRAAMAGDLQGFLASQFGNLADMALTKLGESIFDSFSNAPAAIATAQAEGAAQGLAFSTTVGPTITASGATAAAAMGTAIVTSGTTVAALIAQAMAAGNTASTFASAFGGGRAGGGRVRAGFSYDVGENGREKFVAPSNGYIIPNMKNATAKAGMSGMVKIVVGEGEMFTARVTEISGPLSIQTAATSAAYSQDQMVKSQKRSGQRIF